MFSIMEITTYSFSKIKNGTQNVIASFLRALTHILECDFNDIFELSGASYYNKEESRKRQKFKERRIIQMNKKELAISLHDKKYNCCQEIAEQVFQL